LRNARIKSSYVAKKTTADEMRRVFTAQIRSAIYLRETSHFSGKNTSPVEVIFPVEISPDKGNFASRDVSPVKITSPVKKTPSPVKTMSDRMAWGTV
jgi:hypothetical protein